MMITVGQLLEMLHSMPTDGVVEIREYDFGAFKALEFDSMQVVTRCYKEDVDLKESTGINETLESYKGKLP